MPTQLASPSPRTSQRRTATAVARRWPTALGAAVATAGLATFAALPHQAKLDLTGWSVLLAAVVYLTWGTVRGDLHHGRGLLTAQTAAVLSFGALAVIAAALDPAPARYLLAAGWLAHAGWDVVHHRLNRVVPRWYAETCLVIDITFALALVATGWL